jgi:iron complex transport system ATP-binding protein
MQQITTKNLSVLIKDRRIIEPISLSITAGEMVALVGANGSGKTTLMRAMLQLIPHQGFCNLAAMPTVARAAMVSWVPQDRDIVWDITVRQLLTYTAEKRYASDKRSPSAMIQAIDDALDFSGIPHLDERRLKTLSGGELTLALIARALVQNTPVIFMDEPLASLDPFQKLNILGLMQNMAKAGKAVLATIHDADLARQHFTRVVALRNGTLIADGEPKEILLKQNLETIYGSG